VLIRTYEVQFVPGLLQTEAYARAVILLGHAGPDAEDLERRVDLRLARRRILTRADCPRFWAVIDEAVLRRPIGGPAVMRAPDRGVDRGHQAAGRPGPWGGCLSVLQLAEQLVEPDPGQRRQTAPATAHPRKSSSR
jgi:hypothetical protein